MKVISAKNKNFDKLLDNLLSKRKNKLRSDYISVKNIIKDVRKNGDKALVKYEKRFNKNTKIRPSAKEISNLISSLDKKVKVAIDNMTTHEIKVSFLSSAKMQCNSVVRASHGISETFSTGSQNQNPPQPNS